MSLSTVSWLKVVALASRIARCSSSGAIVASVTITAIMVAICGAIMPEPLQIAARVMGLPSISNVRLAILTRVSVVMIASAAASGSMRRLATSDGSAVTILSTGSLTPMTPVDAESTAPAGTPSAAPTAAWIWPTASMPAGPVSALALPALMTTACTPAIGSRFSASSAGAALARLTVTTPAAAQGSSLVTRARSLRCGLMPAATPENLNPIGSFTGRTSAECRAPSSPRSRGGDSGSAPPDRRRP